jgi:integrase
VAITAKKVENIKPAKDRQEIPAGPPGGLMLIIHPTGKKVWALRYRYRGFPAKYTLGNYPVLTLARARAKAIEALADLDRGIDPREKPAEGASAVTAVAEEWLKRRVAGTRTAHEVERMLRTEIVEPWKKKLVSEIDKPDVLRVLDAIVDRGAPVTANRVLSIMKRWLGWARERGYIETSPVADIKRPTVEKSRDRVLSEDELRAVWTAVETLDYPHGPWLKMLILTAQRRTEVASMRWRNIDESKALWTLPAESTKAGRTHDVPLSTVAREVLKSLPRFARGDYVFTHNSGFMHMRTYYEAKGAVDAVIAATGKELARWTIHDLRRTAATLMAERGVLPHILSAILGHSGAAAVSTMPSATVTKIYNRYAYLEERRQALEAWAQYIVSLERKKKAAMA